MIQKTTSHQFFHFASSKNGNWISDDDTHGNEKEEVLEYGHNKAIQRPKEIFLNSMNFRKKGILVIQEDLCGGKY